MTVSDAKKLKHLEDENSRLKHIVADLTLDNQALEIGDLKKLLKPRVRKKQCSIYMESFGLSQRGHADLIGLCRNTIRYQARPDRRCRARTRLKELAREEAAVWLRETSHFCQARRLGN